MLVTLKVLPHVRETRTSDSDETMKIVRVTGMPESLVRGTRPSDSELTTNEMTALN